jgi:Putative MetA-pathway of phenol degradation
MNVRTPRYLASALAGLVLSCNLPADAAELKPICADRPGLGTATCIVEQGHWQVEVGLWDASLQHRDGVTADLTVAADPTIKYGISDNADLEASMALYQSMRVHDVSGTRTDSGVSDLLLHAKWNLTPSGEGNFHWILDPFIKLPTAGHELGNERIEAGLLVPMSYEFGNDWSLDSTPEADMLADGNGDGYHTALVDVVGISRDLPGGFSLGAELWTSQDLDPDGTISQYSLGPALAWLLDSNTQMDGGFAVGLNHETPDLELYAGISRRF